MRATCIEPFRGTDKRLIKGKEYEITIEEENSIYCSVRREDGELMFGIYTKRFKAIADPKKRSSLLKQIKLSNES